MAILLPRQRQGGSPLLALFLIAAACCAVPYFFGQGSSAFLVPRQTPSLRSSLPASVLASTEALPAAIVLPTARSSEAAGSSAALVGGLVVVGVVARDVAMQGTTPKCRRPQYKVIQNKIRWYKRGERIAAEAYELAKGIKENTIDFIYGKPQDEDEYDDDDADDEYDDDDDEDLSKKQIS
mmetsp:Transcript_94559/g.246693  ORF Transcript_94559/g.246693 Transcript_94559/m.246693 type:complete len:181 (-) Transcript_94559:183-725(-)